MLFWLKKALTLLFLPLSFSLLSGIAAMLCLAFRREVWARRLFIISLLVLASGANKAVSVLLSRPLETQFPAVPEWTEATSSPEILRDCRAVIVLGGGHSPDNDRSRLAQLSASALFRLTEGIRLARLLPDAKLVVSGHSSEGATHSEVLAEAAASLGFPRERIGRLDTPRDTEDEARAVATQYSGQKVAVVTSAVHMPRSMALFHHVGLHPVACPTDFHSLDASVAAADWVHWDLGSLDRSTRSIRERVGRWWNWLRGRG